MTRYAIDLHVALRLAEDAVTAPVQHQLVAPALLRSQALSLLYQDVRRGERTEKDALNLMERITTMKIRLLGDRVSRSVAWKIASDLDWDDTAAAEYLAVARLQADRFVTLDPKLRRAANGIIPLAEIAELYERRV